MTDSFTLWGIKNVESGNVFQAHLLYEVAKEEADSYCNTRLHANGYKVVKLSVTIVEE